MSESSDCPFDDLLKDYLYLKGYEQLKDKLKKDNKQLPTQPL